MTNNNTHITEAIELLTIEFGEFITHPVWFWICIVQFVMMMILLYVQLKKRPAGNEKDDSVETKKAVKNEINMHALMDNITKSSKLYKQLSRKCHPDRFVNNPRQQIAEEIFKEITRRKRNYEKLTHLKNRAIRELNINI